MYVCTFGTSPPKSALEMVSITPFGRCSRPVCISEPFGHLGVLVTDNIVTRTAFGTVTIFHLDHSVSFHHSVGLTLALPGFEDRSIRFETCLACAKTLFNEMCRKAWWIWPPDMEFDRTSECPVEPVSLLAGRVVLIAAVVPTCFVLKDIHGTLDGVIRGSIRIALGADVV